ncbi:fatty acid desaturase-domain-containing protein [Ochromonadaceae sp. CCMP2298]|nr:fatty acid desaturase-domain-containing protein [Ochromonadaceae sp. CCMP2298]
MGKGGEKSVVAEKKEVLIEGRFYDVTNMKHPGGSVINFYAGKDIDASQAFNNFHIRSRKAKKILEHLSSRVADEKEIKQQALPGQLDLLADFDQLTRDLEKEGFFEPAPLHVAYRCLEILAIYSAGFYLMRNGQILLGLLLAAVAQGRCGWLMHEGGHYSLTGNITLDRGLQILFYGVGCGMSGSWWRSQHNKHHAMPQKIGHDVDLNTLPLVAFTEKVAKRVGLPLRWWIRMQAVMFPMVTTLLVTLGWQYYLHIRHIIRVKNFYEMGAIAARHVIWTSLVTAQFGLAQSALMFLAYNWLASNYIFLNFAVSHTHLDVVPKEDTQVDWVRYAAIYTMNVSPGPFKIVSWWMSYLNFQIEHHMFPSMPQFRHPIISPRIKALLEKHGLKYDQRDYISSMAATFNNLHKVGADVFLG